MTIRRVAVALVLAGLGLVGLATPAFAHAELISSNPAKDATVDRPPTQLQLTFNETVSPESITVTGPAGAQWTVGQITVEGPVVTAPVIASGPAGQYTINYRVLSDDGDPVSGTVSFTTKSAAIAATRTEPAPTAQGSSGSNDTGKGLPAWVWVLAIVVLLGIGGVVGRWVSRRGSGPDQR
jgi:methionine-rich copper-binding protein CopC